MPCSIVTAKGPCKMPALKSRTFCFVHAPENQKARKVASARGGSSRKRFIAPSLLPPETPPTFDLGRLEGAADVAPALLRVSRAIARGEIDHRLGRLLTESLRVSARAFEAAPSNVTPGRGWDSMTIEELNYMRENDSRLPPGRTLEELDRVG